MNRKNIYSKSINSMCLVWACAYLWDRKPPRKAPNNFLSKNNNDLSYINWLCGCRSKGAQASKRDWRTMRVHVQKTAKQNYLTVCSTYKFLRVRFVFLNLLTLSRDIFVENKQCSIVVSSGHSLLWNMEFKTLFEGRRPVFFKVHWRVGNGGWTVQAEQRQAAEDTCKKSHLKKKKKKTCAQ